MSADSPHASSIVCESLSIRFQDGPAAVRDVDLEVPAGEILALIGPSGCGKTTILRLMAGLETPTSGSVVMDPPQTSDIGGVAFVFQQPTLLKWRTALENAMLPLELISDWRGRTARQGQGSSRQVSSRQVNGRPDARKAASDSLRSVGLQDAFDRYPHQLSGGMRMRVSIARALVTEPRVLLLDEPFAALDDMLRSQLGQMVLDLWQRQRFTAVMVTHNVAESILLSHRVAVMHAGRLTEIIENSLPWPRTEALRSTPEFGQLYGRVSRSLRRDA